MQVRQLKLVVVKRLRDQPSQTWSTRLMTLPPSTVKPWNVPEKYYECNRDALQTRSKMVPYLYTATRQAYDTGVSNTVPPRPCSYRHGRL